jgi:5-deoxy-D-glucuronate isomerase
MTSNEKRRLVETAILEEADAAAKELVVAFFNGGGATSHFPSDEVEK